MSITGKLKSREHPAAAFTQSDCTAISNPVTKAENASGRGQQWEKYNGFSQNMIQALALPLYLLYKYIWETETELVWGSGSADL